MANEFKVKNGVMFTSGDSIAATSAVESWIYSKDLSISGQDTEPRDLEFSSDGTKLYILGNAGNDVTQYNLSTAWDISTASASSTFSVGTQETTPNGLFFKPDGTRFFVTGANDTVYRYDLSTAWNITTASYVNSFSVTAQETDPQAISFSSDGTKMYITGTSGDDINQYNLGTAWDITTAVYSTVFSVSAYASAPQGLAFSSDGTKFWIVGSTFNRIAEFTMSTPWSIATASYSGAVNVGLLGTYAVLGSSGIYVNLSQNKAWITDYQNDRVFELSTNTAATKLYGSKWLVEPDLHLEQDLVVNRNSRINGSLYVPGYASVGNMGVTGTLYVRAALDLADNDVLRFGSSDDWEMYHSSTDSTNYIDLTVGNIIVRDDGTTGDPVRFTFERTTGNFTASTITSNVETGTAPFTVSSTTAVSNLNADLLDGQHGSYYAAASSIGSGTFTVNTGGGLTGGAQLGTANQSDNTSITISHSDTSSVSNLGASSRTYVTGLTFDTYGHVTDYTVGTETVTDTVTRLRGTSSGNYESGDLTLVAGSNITISQTGTDYTISASQPSVGNGSFTVNTGSGLTGGAQLGTANQSGNTSITISHSDTSSQVSASNSGNTFIQSITLDDFGHITAMTSAEAAGGSSSALTIDNKTAAYTVVAGDLGKIINCTANSFTVSLTAAATLGAGFNCWIWNTSNTTTHAITIDPNGSETIDGKLTLVLRRGDGLQIVCDGTNWQTGDKKTMRGYSENIDSGENMPSATGSGSIAIGDSGQASGERSLCIVPGGGSATGNYSVAIGRNASNGGSQAITGAGAMALGGSYASGTNSFAAAVGNNASSYGATGNTSLSLGYQSKSTGTSSAALGYTAAATGSYSVAIGYSAVASGTNAIALGGWYSYGAPTSSAQSSIAIGDGVTADANWATALGSAAITNGIRGKYVYSSGRFASNGDSQTGTYVLRKATTSVTSAVLTTNDSTPYTDNQIILPNNSAFAFSGIIVGRKQASTGTDSAAWEVKGLLRREGSAGTTVLVNSAITVIDNTPNWNLILSADTSNGGLTVRVVGAASTNIRWVATLQTSEVTYA